MEEWPGRGGSQVAGLLDLPCPRVRPAAVAAAVAAAMLSLEGQGRRGVTVSVAAPRLWRRERAEVCSTVGDGGR